MSELAVDTLAVLKPQVIAVSETSLTSKFKGNIEGIIVDVNITGYSTFLSLRFSWFNTIISDSFSLDIGKDNRPFRISSTSLSIKAENFSSLNSR